MSKFELYNGNCLDVMQTITPNSIDAIICDPPYGITSCDWDSVITLDIMWEGIKRVLKKNGAVVLFGSQPFSSKIVTSNLKWFKYDWVWSKNMATGFATAKFKPMRTHEDILVFCEGRTVYNYILEPTVSALTKKLAKNGTKRKCIPQNSPHSLGLKNEFKETDYRDMVYPKSVQRFNCVPRRSSLHPSQKPIELIEYLVKTYTNEFDTILDFTMGSGTTGVACANTNRNFIGIELDEKYFGIAKERIETAYKEKG